jgi:hypothetical protein
MIRIQKPSTHLYQQYPGQSEPQGTYLELDPGARALSANYDAEIGGAVPVAVWHGQILRYALPSPYLRAEMIGEIMDEIAPLAKRVCDGHETVWGGSNNVGQLSEDAREAEQEIERILEERGAQLDDDDVIHVWDAADYFSSAGINRWIERARELTDDALETALLAEADDYCDILTGVEGFIGYLRDKIADQDEDELSD